MTYGDARYQTKRISISGLRSASSAPHSDQGSPQPTTQHEAATSFATLSAASVRPTTQNPYAPPQKRETFMAPIPDSDPPPPAPAFSYMEADASLATAGSQHIGATRIYELAEKYVSVFQANAIANMTPEQRHALIVEVATFYSAPFRAGRLEALVSVFEG